MTSTPEQWIAAERYVFSPGSPSISPGPLSFRERMQFIDHMGTVTPGKSSYLPKVKPGYIQSPPWIRQDQSIWNKQALALIRAHNAKLKRPMYNATPGLGPPLRVTAKGAMGTPISSPKRKRLTKKKNRKSK